MTTAWYYDFYEPGKFPHQETLCKSVEWTKCNLEGRQLVSATHLTGIPANPLTIRLLALQKALNQLETNVNPIKEAIKKQSEKKFSKGKMFEMGGSLITQESDLVKTGGAPVEIIKIRGKRKPIEWHYDAAHLALYEFFTNFGSLTDRLAYEIDLLYELKTYNVDWPKLADIRTDIRKGKDKPLKTLNSKDRNLERFIRNFSSKLTQAIRYRNRLVHDGIIKIEASFSISGSIVTLAEDPNNDGSPMNVDAISFCKTTKRDVLKLLDESYKLMLQHYQSQGNPPW